MKLLPKRPLQRAIISIANANNFVTLDMDTLSTLRDSSATLHRTSWMDTLSNLRDSSAARRRWSKSRDWETQLKSIARRKTVFSDHVKEILPMIDTSSLDILMKESLVKRRNNEYQGALRWPLKLNLQQDLSLGENLPGKCLKYLVLYIPNMLPATSAIKKCSPFLQ